MPHRYFITGIGTGVGKTIVSAIFTQALHADYWKPVQSGDLEHTDSDSIRTWIDNPVSAIHPETYRLTKPMSPHASAEADGIQIDPARIVLPETKNHLIVEGAGGLMVPLNRNFLFIDLIEQLQIPVVLVSDNYLGSINHTILSAEALQRRNIPIAGIVFNHCGVETTESFIREYTHIPVLLRIEAETEWNTEVIKKYAPQLVIS